MRIYHWERCTRKQFLLVGNTTFNSLKIDILTKFHEELDGQLFRMYYLTKDRNVDITERQQIETEEMLVSCVQRIFKMDDIELIIFNAPIRVREMLCSFLL